MLIPAPEALLFVPGGHQNGIVHRGAQLDGTDADGGDKGQGRAGIEGNAQIDEDGELNDRHQDDRQGDGFQHQGDDDENRRDGNDVDHLKIPVGDGDQILGAGGFPDEHAVFVVLFQYGVDIVHLPVDLVGRHFVPGTDQHELILIALKQAGQRLGQNFLRNSKKALNANFLEIISLSLEVLL